MRLLIACAAATALSLILVLPASAVPIHVHEEVEVKKESADAEVVRGDPLTVLETYTETKTVERVEHVPPVDEDQDGIADSNDPCIGACPAPEPEPSTPVTETTTASATGAPLSSIAACESGGDYGAVDPSGTYWGAYQFDAGTWASVSDAPYGSASPAEQDAAAAALYAQSGASPWPVCGQ